MLKGMIDEGILEIKEKIQKIKIGYINKQREKERNRERKKRRKHKGRFGQATMKHSTMGMYSCGYAGASAFILLLSIVISYFSKGKAAGFVGGFGLIALIFAILGMNAAIKGMRERERNYITCKIGIGCSGVLTLGLVIIFLGGLI